MPQPFDFNEAWEQHREATTLQRDAEDHLHIQNRDYAMAEEAYRKSLAAEQWRLRNQDGVAWSALGDLSRGDVEVARLKRIRDEKEGDRSIAQHAVFRRVADRRDLERLIEWSMKRELAEGFRDDQDQAQPARIGPSTFDASKLSSAA